MLSAGCGRGPTTPPGHLARDEREGAAHMLHPCSFLRLLVSRLDSVSGVITLQSPACVKSVRTVVRAHPETVVLVL